MYKNKNQYETFGEWLKNWRLSHGLTQTQLANKIGVGKLTVIRWEKHNAKPQICLWQSLAYVLGVNIAELKDIIK